MKRRSAFSRLNITLLVAFVSLLTITQVSVVSLLRGRLIDGANQGVGGISVTTFSTTRGRSTPATSGSDGMYNLSIPPGAYILEIWVNPQQPLRFNIVVRDPNTDVPPIRVR
jgi:Carboxypeptidase regulatory-like domain